MESVHEMASSLLGLVGSCGAAGEGVRGVTVRCDAHSSSPCTQLRVGDPYGTLRIGRGASQVEVKKAFRQLALQYHPDVCKGSNCLVQFQDINEAYDMVMSNIRSVEEDLESRDPSKWVVDDEDDEMRGVWESSWELWEEWMGWEGAGTGDYSSHINANV